LRTAGLAQMWQLGDPVCSRLTGVKLNQDDLPWWYTAILGWIAMVRSIREAYGWDGAEGYRQLLDQRLERENPAFVYLLYKEWALVRERESKR